MSPSRADAGEDARVESRQVPPCVRQALPSRAAARVGELRADLSEAPFAVGGCERMPLSESEPSGCSMPEARLERRQ